MNVIHGDCLDVLRAMPSSCVDLVFCSPPYEAARTYGIDFSLRGQEWVDWCVERFMECCRVCRGLVAWVVEGQTRKYKWSAAPALMLADLHRRGVNLRKPPIFSRVGIPGSGGPDWLRNDWEWIVCATPPGKLAWSDNTAMGHPPKWAPGGEMSNRLSDGSRRNQWGGSSTNGGSTNERDANGRRSGKPRPSHVLSVMRQNATEPKPLAYLNGEMPPGAKLHTKNDGDGMRVQCYTPPVKANPGNIIRAIVGGGVMGSRLCHENEAPFPESLAEFFVRSFCPPGGRVLDPFCGSGTTLAVAKMHGRRGIGIDVRESQVALTLRRLAEAEAAKKAG